MVNSSEAKGAKKQREEAASKLGFHIRISIKLLDLGKGDHRKKETGSVMYGGMKNSVLPQVWSTKKQGVLPDPSFLRTYVGCLLTPVLSPSFRFGCLNFIASFLYTHCLLSLPSPHPHLI